MAALTGITVGHSTQQRLVGRQNFELHKEIEAWQKECNQSASKVVWHFTTEEARVKLKHLYPVFEENNS